MHVIFSVLKFHWESIITPVHPCNFMAFFIMAIIYNNLAVMLASSLASVFSDSLQDDGSEVGPFHTC